MKIVGLMLFVACAIACEKDDDKSNCERLEGNWQAESWVVGSVELLGATATYTAVDIDFDALTGQQGNYTQNTTYVVGLPLNVIGTYAVNTDCDQVTLTPKDGLPVIFEFHFNDDKLVLENSINGTDTTIRFQKE